MDNSTTWSYLFALYGNEPLQKYMFHYAKYKPHYSFCKDTSLITLLSTRILYINFYNINTFISWDLLFHK